MYFYVYFLVNEKNNHYIGCTGNLKNRLKSHNLGFVRATKGGVPWKLKSCFVFDNKKKAFSFEQYLKTAAGRTFAKKHEIWS